MKADLGCVWPTDATPGPYSTSTPFILFPGTFGRALSKTTVAFGPSSAAIPERTPTVATSAQTISVRRNSPTDSEVRIRFIVMFLSVMWFVVLAICGEEILSVFFLNCGALEPVLVMRRAETGVSAGNKALIVYRDAVVANLVVGDHLPRVASRT